MTSEVEGFYERMRCGVELPEGAVEVKGEWCGPQGQEFRWTNH